MHFTDLAASNLDWIRSPGDVQFDTEAGYQAGNTNHSGEGSGSGVRAAATARAAPPVNGDDSKGKNAYAGREAKLIQ